MTNTIYTNVDNNDFVDVYNYDCDDEFDRLFELYGCVYEDDPYYGTKLVVADARYTYAEMTL